MAGEPFLSAENKFEAIAAHDAIVETSGALTTLAASTHENRQRHQASASGPRCGIGELILPANQPGSSIMPGKVNPAQCEALTMIAAQVMGNNTTIGIAGRIGDLELNVLSRYSFIIFFNRYDCLPTDAGVLQKTALTESRQTEGNKGHVDGSLMLVTALGPRLGYETAARIAKKTFDENCTLKAAAPGPRRIDRN